MNYIPFVNIKQGTRSEMRFSNGNTLPLVQLPFGFAAFAPQTNTTRGSWFFHPDDRSFEGIRLTRQPSPWIGEHGAFVFMPQIERPTADAGRRWSSFDPQKTVLTPCYMRYELNRTYSSLELTPSRYGAKIRLRFKKDYPAYLSILPVDGSYAYRLDPESGRVYCTTDCDTFGGPKAGALTSYAVLSFSPEDIDPERTIVENRSGEQRMDASIDGKNAAIHIALKSREIECTLTCSFISHQQALTNGVADGLEGSFDTLMEQNERVWNDYLGRIEIRSDDGTMRTFYSCMYRAFLYPHAAYEVGEDGSPIHVSVADGTVRPGYRYTDNGFWDTYRTSYPFYSIVAPEECKQMIEGYVHDYEEFGWFPCWTAGTPKKCMPSTAIDAILADCATKGLINRELLKVAFDGMEKHANQTSDNPVFGREGCADYLKLGYVPCDKYRESVNLTLDAAYFDDCLATVADLLGETVKRDKYLIRAKNYRSLFDPSVKSMRPKDSLGAFKPDFSPIRWGGDYTEAAAMQTAFAVQHDPEGLAELYGGKEKLLAAIDGLFENGTDFLVGGYGQEIHEMSEMAAAEFGQCAISNQPSFHLPFFHAYFGDRATTTKRVHDMCKKAFSWQDDGFPGDEDNGSMAIWYIFAAIGLYPFCPGKAYYTCHTPMVQDITILGRKLELPRDSSSVSHKEVLRILSRV